MVALMVMAQFAMNHQLMIVIDCLFSCLLQSKLYTEAKSSTTGKDVHARVGDRSHKSVAAQSAPRTK